MIKKTYSPKEICKLAKISGRQLGYWKLIGIIRPGQELHGSRMFYRYTERDLEVLKAVQKLTEQGYLVSKAAEKIRAALAGGEEISAYTLMNLANVPLASRPDLSQTSAKGMKDFQRRVEEELVRSRRFKYPLSCLAIKVEISPPDNDDAAREAAQKIQNMLNSYKRAYDMVVQSDRQEFLWLLCQTAATGAQILARRIPALFPEREWVIGNVRCSVRIYVGQATIEPTQEKEMNLVERARAALNILV